MWRRMPDERKFRFRSRRWFPPNGLRVIFSFVRQQRRQHQLGHVFRQRRNRGENQRGWPTEKNRHRQWLIQTLRFVVMKPATF